MAMSDQYRVSRVRLSPDGWVAQHVGRIPGRPAGGWMVAYVHPGGFLEDQHPRGFRPGHRAPPGSSKINILEDFDPDTVHPGGFLAIDILTDSEVADWAPLLPRWARQDDEYEPEILVDWGDDDGPG